MGKTRTKDEMIEAGVTKPGAELIEAVTEKIAERWRSREDFLQHFNEHATPKPKIPWSKQRLSKELGDPRKPNGPEWHDLKLIASCFPAEHSAFLAKLAGLYCVARDLEEIKGYDGRITWPRGAPNRAGSATAELAAARTDAEKLRARVAELEETLRVQVEELEEENTRLTETIRRESAHHLAALQQARHERDIAREAVLSQEGLLKEGEAREADRDRRDAVVAKRTRYLRERYAQLAAYAEGRLPAPEQLPFPGRAGQPELAPAVQRGGLELAADFDAKAPATWRRLAVYLHVHQEQSGEHLANVAKTAGISLGQVKMILTARELPNKQLVEKIAKAVGAWGDHVRLLHAEAAGNDTEAALEPPASIDDFDSIVAFSMADTIDFSKGASPPAALVVPLSSGDGDKSAMGDGDNGDGFPAWPPHMSPRAEDIVAQAGDNGLSPILVETTALATCCSTLNRSPSHIRVRRRRRWIFNAIVLAGTLLMSAGFGAVVSAMPGEISLPAQISGVVDPASPLTVFAVIWIACVGCWAIAAIAALLLHRGYRGRHTAKGRRSAFQPRGLARGFIPMWKPATPPEDEHPPALSAARGPAPGLWGSVPLPAPTRTETVPPSWPHVYGAVYVHEPAAPRDRASGTGHGAIVAPRPPSDPSTRRALDWLDD